MVPVGRSLLVGEQFADPSPYRDLLDEHEDEQLQVEMSELSGQLLFTRLQEVAEPFQGLLPGEGVFSPEFHVEEEFPLRGRGELQERQGVGYADLLDGPVDLLRLEGLGKPLRLGVAEDKFQSLLRRR